MQHDPERSLEDWQAALWADAARAWGEERARVIAPVLQRTATALWRVTRRRPAFETAPLYPGASGQELGGGDARAV